MQQSETLPKGDPYFSHDCWYLPHGKHMPFSKRSGIVSVYPGMYVIRDKKTLAEARRVLLKPDLQFAWDVKDTTRLKFYSASTVTIKFVNGRSRKGFDFDWTVYFGRPLYGSDPGEYATAQAFKDACIKAVDEPLRQDNLFSGN